MTMEYKYMAIPMEIDLEKLSDFTSFLDMVDPLICRSKEDELFWFIFIFDGSYYYDKYG